MQAGEPSAQLTVVVADRADDRTRLAADAASRLPAYGDVLVFCEDAASRAAWRELFPRAQMTNHLPPELLQSQVDGRRRRHGRDETLAPLLCVVDGVLARRSSRPRERDSVLCDAARFGRHMQLTLIVTCARPEELAPELRVQCESWIVARRAAAALIASPRRIEWFAHSLGVDDPRQLDTLRADIAANIDVGPPDGRVILIDLTFPGRVRVDRHPMADAVAAYV